MARGQLTAALVAIAAALVIAGASSAAAALPAKVELASCSYEDHAAAFHARMGRIAGTERMAMRFTLLERTGSEGFSPLRTPGLGRWHRSQPGVAAFAYRQALRNLPSGAVHRVRVDFRWLAPGGAVLTRERRLSPPCRQFAALPNLRVAVLGVERTATPGVVRYTARLRNSGQAAAAAVAVRLAVDGTVLDTLTVAELAAGGRRELSFRGPECAGSVRADADPDGLIVESFEDDNSHDVPCPSLTARTRRR
jgi:hypothetical protein